jgi:DNA mismatch repair ATPase MutS
MNVWLLYENSEHGSNNAEMNKNEVIKDLNLDIIFKFMARNDKYIYKTVRSVMTDCLTNKGTVLYRQAILADCLKNYEDFNQFYEMTASTMDKTEQFLESVKKVNQTRVSNSVSVLHSLELLGILVENLEKVKLFLDKAEVNFTSPGMRAFYDRLISDYSYEFVEKIKSSINEMNFLTTGGEITFSATVGQGLKAKDIIVNHLTKEEFKKRKTNGLATILFYKLIKRNVILLDESQLAHEVREMEAAGLAHVMKMYQNFIKELSSFFESLHFQLAFYIGCANLKNRLAQMNIPTGMPNVLNKEFDSFKFKGLYDLSMAIYNRSMPVSNDLDTEEMQLFIITGANQGGKSTYLRSIGIAQIMLQSGMFVPAAYYSNRLFDGIFTHFTRREDTAMNSGKLDEELNRMSHILNDITPHSLLLMNESFATTTEREGSKIASDVVKALYENGTRMILVTHLFEFTKAMYERKLEKARFLSAQRLPDGTRTYKILEQEPERTSYGLDLYENIIGK